MVDQRSLIFTKNGDKLHPLQQSDEGGRKTDFEARLFKPKDDSFIELYQH